MATIYLPMNGYGFPSFIFISKSESGKSTNHFYACRAEVFEKEGAAFS